MIIFKDNIRIKSDMQTKYFIKITYKYLNYNGFFRLDDISTLNYYSHQQY